MKVPADYKLIVDNLMMAAKGLPANTMARIVNSYTPGQNWRECNKRYIAEQLARKMDAPRTRTIDAKTFYTWREFYTKLRDELAEEKRPPTKKEREIQKIRERLLYEADRDEEVDEWLRGGHEPGDIDAQIQYALDQLSAAQSQVVEAQMKRRRLLRIRATLANRKRKSA